MLGFLLFSSCAQQPKLEKTAQQDSALEEQNAVENNNQAVETIERSAELEGQLNTESEGLIEPEDEPVSLESSENSLDEASLAELSALKEEQKALEESIAFREAMMLEANAQKEQFESFADQQALGQNINVDFGALLGNIIDALQDIDLDAVLDLIQAVLDADIDAIIDAIIDIVASLAGDLAGLNAQLTEVNSKIESLENP